MSSERATEQRRQMLAYYAFTGAHLVMIIGVILVAAGITDVIHPLSTSRLTAGGSAAAPRSSSWAMPPIVSGQRPDHRPRSGSRVRGTAGRHGVACGRLARHGLDRSRSFGHRRRRPPYGGSASRRVMAARRPSLAQG